MVCKFCGGLVKPVRTELDVSRTPALIPVMLACVDCGQPIRLLHAHPASLKPRTKAERNRVARAERRRALEGVNHAAS